MKLKICGIREPENLKAVLELKPDYVGLIFYPPSPRYVGEKARELRALVKSSQAKAVGVFVNEARASVQEKVQQLELTAVQLHGNESPFYCEELVREAPEIELIKAFPVDEKFDFQLVKPYCLSCSYVLFDTKGTSYGGTGIRFDWDLLQKYEEELPFFLSGGIGINDLEQIKELGKTRSDLYAVDMNSNIEERAGVKDISLVQQAIEEIRR